MFVLDVIDQQVRSVLSVPSPGLHLKTMSLTRRAVVAARTRPAVFALQLRAASTSQDHHDDHHQQDTTTYPPEGVSIVFTTFIFSVAYLCYHAGFVNPFWGKVLLFSFLTGAAVKYAPEARDDLYLTRWIALYSTPRDYWLALNAKHTAQSEEVAGNNLLVSDAKAPPIHRFRYPQ